MQPDAVADSQPAAEEVKASEEAKQVEAVADVAEDSAAGGQPAEGGSVQEENKEVSSFAEPDAVPASMEVEEAKSSS